MSNKGKNCFHTRSKVMTLAVVGALCSVAGSAWAGVPTIANTKIQTNDGTGSSHKIAVMFSEAVMSMVNGQYLGTSDFRLSGSAAAGVSITSVENVANSNIAILSLSVAIPDVTAAGVLKVDATSAIRDSGATNAFVPGAVQDLNGALTDADAPTLSFHIDVNNSVQPNTITLIFDEALGSQTAVETASNWTVTNGAGTPITYTIASAELNASRTGVTLTLADVDPADPSTYITIGDAGNIIVAPAATVTDLVGNAISTSAVTNAGGTLTNDTTEPTVWPTLAKNSATTVTLSFSEPVNKADAETAGYYSLSGTGNLTGEATSAVLQSNGTDVLLTVPSMAGFSVGKTLVVTVNMVNDVSGNGLASLSKTATWTETGAPSQPSISATSIEGGGSIAITQPGAGETAWLAPAGTTVFATGGFVTDMTSSSGTSIYAPTKAGTYYLYLKNASGVSTASANAVKVTSPELIPVAPGLTVGKGVDVPLYRFALPREAGKKIMSVKVQIDIDGATMPLVTTNDFDSFALYTATFDADGNITSKTLVGDPKSGVIDFSGPISIVPHYGNVAPPGFPPMLMPDGVSVDATATYVVVATMANNVSDGKNFKVIIPADAVVLDGGTFTSNTVQGQVDITTDAVEPTLSSLTLGTPAGTSVEYTATSNEAGKGYYVVLPAADAAPSWANVIAGLDNNNAVASIKGNGIIVANTPKTFAITGLTAATAYKLYFTAPDAAGNYPSTWGDIQTFTTAGAGAAAQAPADDGGSTTQTEVPTPSDPTLPAGVDMPEGLDLVFVKNIGSVLDSSGGPAEGVTLSGGMLLVDTNALGSGGLSFSGGAQSGVAFMLNDTASDKSVSITIGGQTFEVNPEGNALMSIGLIQNEDGTSSQAIVLSTGSASMTGDKPGESLGALGGAGNASVSAGTAGTQVSMTSGSDGGSVSVTSGEASITVSGLDGDFAATNKFAADSKQKVTLFAGEKAILTKAGRLSSITLATGNAAISLTGKPTPVTINAVVPNINSQSARTKAKLSTSIASTMNATLEDDGQNSRGALALVIGEVRVTAMPVGEVKVFPARVDGATLRKDGLVEIATKGVVTTFAPAVSDINELAAAMPSGSKLEVDGYGVMKATIGNVAYFLRPSWSTTRSGDAPGFSTGLDHTITYVDSKGNATVFKPAFAHIDMMLDVVAKDVPAASVKINEDGTATLSVDGGTTFTLTPEMTASTLGKDSPPAVFAGKRWWQESDGKLYLYVGSMLQRFTVK